MEKKNLKKNLSSTSNLADSFAYSLKSNFVNAFKWRYNLMHTLLSGTDRSTTILLREDFTTTSLKVMGLSKKLILSFIVFL